MLTTQTTLKELVIVNTLCCDKDSIISRSLRNLPVDVKLGEMVHLKNLSENKTVLAKVISQTAEWLTEFQIIEPA